MTVTEALEVVRQARSAKESGRLLYDLSRKQAFDKLLEAAEALAGPFLRTKSEELK